MFAVLVLVVVAFAAAPTVAFIINFMQQLFQLASFAYIKPTKMVWLANWQPFQLGTLP